MHANNQEYVQYGYAISTEAAHYPERDAIGADNERLFTMNNKIWIFLVLAVVIGAVLFALLRGSGQESLEQKYGLYLPDPHQTGTTGSPATGKLDLRLTDPIKSLDRMISNQGNADSSIGAAQQPAVSPPPGPPASAESTQAIEIQTPPATDQAGGETGAVVEPQQASVAVPTGPLDSTGIAAVDTPPPSPPSEPETALPEAPAAATPGTDSAASGQPDALEPSPAADSKAAITESQTPAIAKPPAPSAAKQGPWVINIASSQDKAYADLLAEKARSRDFQTELQQVTVKGRQYWRVQITGFSTKEEARASVGNAKEALGLKDAWVTTR